MRPWEAFVPAAERQLYQKAGYTPPAPRLGHRPALLIVDVTQAFTGGPSPQQAVAYATACNDAWAAVAVIGDLLQIARPAGWPVIFTTGNGPMEKFIGGATRRPRSGGDANAQRDEIPQPLAPQKEELVIRKNKASAFFDTPLASYLHRCRVDTLMLVGTSTSGCVRATAVDAFSHGFDLLVVEEAVFDRSPTLHMANLFDINAKYGAVITKEQALTLMQEN